MAYKDRESRAEYQREYYKAFRAKILAQRKTSQLLNPPPKPKPKRRAEYQRQYFLDNREKLNEYRRKYWKEHPEKRKAITRKYIAAKKLKANAP